MVEKRNEKDEIIEISPIKSITYMKQGSIIGSSSSNDATQFNVPAIITQQQKDKPDLLRQQLLQPQQDTLKSSDQLNQSTPKSSTKPPQPQLNNVSLKFNTSNGKNLTKSHLMNVPQKPNSSPMNNNNNKKVPQNSQSSTAVVATAQVKQKPLQSQSNHVNHNDKVEVVINDESFNKTKQAKQQLNRSQMIASLAHLVALKFDGRKTTKIVSKA